MDATELNKVIDEYHRSLDGFMRGNAEDILTLFSHREEVTLGNPFGPWARGLDKVGATATLASSHMQDGKAQGFDRIVAHVAPDFACIFEVEHVSTKLDGGKEPSPHSLRVMTLVLPEDGSWRTIRRHADPITSVRSWGSVVEKQPSGSWRSVFPTSRGTAHPLARVAGESARPLARPSEAVPMLLNIRFRYIAVLAPCTQP